MTRIDLNSRTGDLPRYEILPAEFPRSRFPLIEVRRGKPYSVLRFSVLLVAALLGSCVLGTLSSAVAEPSSGFEFQYYGPLKKSFHGGMSLGAAASVSAFERASQEYLRWKRPGMDLNQFGRVLVMPVKEASKEMTLYYWRVAGVPAEGWVVRLDLDAKVQSADIVYQLPPDVLPQVKVGQTTLLLAFPGGVRKTLTALAESAKARGGIPPKAILAQQNFRVFYSAPIKYGVALHYPLGTTCKSWAVEFNDKAEPVEGREVAESRC